MHAERNGDAGAAAEPRPISVLIADDDDRFALALSAMLETQQRVRVVGRARDGNEAVRLATALAPDLVTMDIDMPLMDGVAATAAIAAALPAASIVVLTGSDSSEDVEAALAAGAARWVTKMNAIDDLIPTIFELAGGNA